MSAPTVFISYSHDSDDHRERVLGLSERLRDDGIETLLDRYVNGSPPQGWPRWMLDQLDRADSVLVVCTETYYRRFRGHEDPGKGKGVDWEGALITQEIYDARSRTLKFIPVLFSAEHENFIPEPLRSATHYTLTSASSYNSLYDFLLGQAGVEPGEVGALKTRARPKGSPLTFAEESPTLHTKVDISRIIKYAPSELIGREEETKLLNDSWDKAVSGETKRPHVLTFVALGGEGKTSLVAKWAADLAHRDWPGCDAAFAWSFYSQGTREQTAVSSDSFLAEALKFFGDPEMAGSPAGAFDKGRRLAQLVGERRALLILDGLEPLQYAPTSPTPGELKDTGVAALLKGLAANNHGQCVVTTRYAITDLRNFWQTTAPMQELPRLSMVAGVELLERIGVQGSLRKTIQSTDRQELLNEFEKLVEDVDGHALTLQIIGQFLVRAFHGDIRRRERVDIQKADAKTQEGHAFRAMEAYVKWLEDESEESRRELALLKLLGLFDRPATADCVAALRSAPAIVGLTEPLVGLAEDDWEFSLTSLRDAKLLTVNREKGSGELVSIDAHPLLREYFARRVREQQPEAWRAAHRRVYQHLCVTTKEGDQPTLEDLQPLYQAVVHGCHAGLQQETYMDVYFGRIAKLGEYYSVRKLGAYGADLGATACFFDELWKRISSALVDEAQALVLSQSAAWLRSLGRLTEALEPMRAGMEMHIKQENWREAARDAGNLSELELTLGEVAAAVADAEQSVAYADRSGDAFSRKARRARVADALGQSSRGSEAETRFREAEDIHAKNEPALPLLYSLSGFQYCELLLMEAERGAWHHILCNAGLTPRQRTTAKRATDNFASGRVNAAIQSCLAVSARATQTLRWVETGQQDILSASLDRVTLGRAALYTAILGRPELPLGTYATDAAQCVPPNGGLFAARRELEAAVAGLRSAGTTHHIPRALLTRAWLRKLTGVHVGPESAQADLDEVWEIVERGPMRLFMADIHLYRARLFHAVKPYPWTSPQDDLASARKLIEQCGYWRRKEELEDAEAAAKNW